MLIPENTEHHCVEVHKCQATTRVCLQSRHGAWAHLAVVSLVSGSIIEIYSIHAPVTVDKGRCRKGQAEASSTFSSY